MAGRVTGGRRTTAQQTDEKRRAESILSDLLRSGTGRTHSCAAAGVQRGGTTLAEGFAGYTSASGRRRRVTRECLFDLASVTKMFTATIVMQSHEEGLIDLEDTAGDIVPDIESADLRRVSVFELLSHTSGLPPLRNSMKRCTSRASVLRVLNSVRVVSPGVPVYSDLGFMLLGEMVERIHGKREDELVRERISRPLGLHSTLFNPDRKGCCAPTGYSPVRKRELVCETHNEVVARMDGVGGHAGMFSSLSELMVFAAALLSDYTDGKHVLLKRPTLKKMVTPVSSLFGMQYGLGFMLRSKDDRGYPSGHGPVFGHTGHTGTSVWMDAGRRLVSILLMNSDAVGGRRQEVHVMRDKFHLFAADLADAR